MSPEATVPVDGHVHIYDCFPLESFLDAAVLNFRSAAARGDGSEGVYGFLLLTETATDHAFRRLAAHGGSAGRWSIRPASDGISLLADSGRGDRLVLVAGRQIRTVERLEVLALGVDREFRDGVAADAAIREALAAGALPVIPWGFGKWSSGRGRIVAGLLQSSLSDRLFVGDSGGRPRGMPEPSLLRAARTRNVPVLAGSDPLPLSWQAARVASYGFRVPGNPDPASPGRWLVEALQRSRFQPPLFGRLTGWISFCRGQTAMQARKLRPRHTA